MKKRRFRLWMLFLIPLFIFAYELIGILAAYGRQPELSEEEKKELREVHWLGTDGKERAAVIEDNAEALNLRLKLMEDAKEKIVMSTFSFHADNSGRLIIGDLLQAAERGVRIQILVDGFESITAMEGNPFFYALSSAENVEIKVYNKLNPFMPWKAMGRMHDKYLIVDGSTYLLGGRNVFDYFLGEFPGHKNYDRDVLVCSDARKENSSVNALDAYFREIWKYRECRLFHDEAKLSEKERVKQAKKQAIEEFEEYKKANAEEWGRIDYGEMTVPTDRIALLENPITHQVKKPLVWERLCSLMRGAKASVKIHTPYIICNDRMYKDLAEISGREAEVMLLTNSSGNNGNAFGAADYRRNKEKIKNTGMQVWEYEGGFSYHAKSILIDDNLSIVGSFNMDMRSTYLDTELMFVIDSKELNRQLDDIMLTYEKGSREYMGDEIYANPYQVTPMEPSVKQKRRQKLIGTFLQWARFLF